MYIVTTAMGVCLKIMYSGYEISVAFERDMIGKCFSRPDIQVYLDDKNVTEEVVGIIDNTFEDIIEIRDVIDRMDYNETRR